MPHPEPPTSPDVAVELRGFGWRHARRSAWAVRGVDLTVRRGERVLLLGASGAGKSTLLAAVAGLLPDDSGESEGEVRVAGRPGVLFQDPETQLVMARAGDDVAFGPENLGVPAGEIWSRVDASLRAVGYPHGRDRRTEALSGGEQQRLALAGVLALRPSVLLLDEPTANLDPAGADLVRAAIARAAGPDTAMLLVEHRVAACLPLVHRVVVIAPGGGVLADGPPAEVFERHGADLAAQGVWVPDGYLPSAAHGPRPARAAGPELLRGTGLCYRHPGADRAALSDVDFTVSAGEALAVLGHNGSGKSTLALLAGGLLAPSAGRLAATPELAGAGPAGRPPHRWRAAALAGAIGSVFQNPEHQFVTGRVADELALGPRRVGRSAAEVTRTVDDLLSRLRLDALADANPYTLSGGEQRRLSVATALATAPRLLVLDEPTFGQDRRTWREIVTLLGGLADDGRGVLAVTHDADLVAALADRSLTLSGGRIHAPAGIGGAR